MPDPIQALLLAGGLPTASLPATSRYAGVPVAAYLPPPNPDAEVLPVPYFGRRLCPPPERFATLAHYRVVEGDRRDLIAATQLGDAELWWRLADANGTADPVTLTRPVGQWLRITLPENVQGAADV